MPKRSAAATPDARFASVIDALAARKGVAVAPGWGAGNFVLKAGGKIFAILSADRFVAKLAKARVDALVEAGAGTRFDPRKNGRVMKEWIVVPDAAQWLDLAREAHEFVTSASAESAGRTRVPRARRSVGRAASPRRRAGSRAR